jgi:cold shock CspA family protein
MQRRGVVVNFGHANFGFLKDNETGQKFFFHSSRIKASRKIPQIGDQVLFEIPENFKSDPGKCCPVRSLEFV